MVGAPDLPLSCAHGHRIVHPIHSSNVSFNNSFNVSQTGVVNMNSDVTWTTMSFGCNHNYYDNKSLVRCGLTNSSPTSSISSFCKTTVPPTMTTNGVATLLVVWCRSYDGDSSMYCPTFDVLAGRKVALASWTRLPRPPKLPIVYYIQIHI